MQCFRWASRVPGRTRSKKLPLPGKWTRPPFWIISSPLTLGLTSRSKENRLGGDFVEKRQGRGQKVTNVAKPPNGSSPPKLGGVAAPSKDAAKPPQPAQTG